MRVLFDMVGDPRPGHGLLGVSDPDVHLINGRWTMFLGAFTTRFSVRIAAAQLPETAAITDDRWRIVVDSRRRAVQYGAPSAKNAWDWAGMHTPCYVRVAGECLRERIYYAGRLTRQQSGRQSRYAIGLLERDGDGWIRRDEPVIVGDAARPSLLEPRVIYADGRWRAWFLSTVGEVGRSELPDYELRYAESADGIHWDTPTTFATSVEGFFDNAVEPYDGRWQMILARGTNLHGTRPYPSQGLWCSDADIPGPRECWSSPVPLIDTDVRPESWLGAGLCGPSFVREVDTDGIERLHVFATGTRRRTPWRRVAWDRVRTLKRPPVPAPYFLATGRLTFDAEGSSRPGRSDP